MCGIAGIITRHAEAPPRADLLLRMAEVLAHRGPDDSGVSIHQSVGLAHRRLSVVDLATGAQPMSIHAGALRIAFNGEVFNHIELRAELEQLGRVFHTRSDTEVILHAYDQWGQDAWPRLNGQFAFAIADSATRAVWLVRDRSGICPLFVARTPRAILFASETRALHVTGLIAPAPDHSALNAAFRLWAAPGKSTVFQGVEVLEPGGVMRIGADLRVRESHYAAKALQAQTTPPSEDEIASVLHDAVRIRLRADIPVGAYLSGGLDSSLIVRLMQVVSGVNAQTFSLRFNHPAFDASFDEGAAQHEAAMAFGITHHELSIGPDDITAALPNVVDHAETPLLRAGPVPMFLLSRFVRAQGVRVVLTGEGADEYFGGYDIFKEAKLRAFLARDPTSPWRQALLQRLHPYVANRGGAMWQHFFESFTADTGAFQSHEARWRNNEWALRFLAPQVRDALSADQMRAQVSASLPPQWELLDDFARAQAIEFSTFLAPYLLSSQGDRMLMAHGVEGRFPFLDPRVIEAASRLSSSQKMIGLREKALLRRVAARVLPRAIASRRKWPFRAPLQGAFFGANAPEYVREALSPHALKQCPLIDAGPSARLCERLLSSDANPSEREQMAAFGVLTTQLWWRRCIIARKATVSASDALTIHSTPRSKREARPRRAPRSKSIDNTIIQPIPTESNP